MTIAAAGLALVAGLAGCSGPSGPTAQDLRAAQPPDGVVYAEIPDDAPPGPDGELVLADGAIAISELTAERPVVLVFLESWCTTCADQQAGVNEAVARYGDAVTFVGVASASDPDDLAAYARDHDVTYALAQDPGGELARAFAVDEAPFAVVLGEGNRLVRGWPYYPADLTDAIEGLLVAELPE
ncbi:TlpA family protein disulfide reductase [Agromyces aerolatus]|uniref:TlpA family protein disulfide reductase n=1 Tax=Agromyces sp. LY-1074 TaxID=3074080 RepID=UPI00285D603D|nr:MULTISPECIES: TlpA disulfide reductase family protein [unclassified Agromyces]MDR5701554.1 TlpA disulfide reductase family protein [Agromyces sp. LY-1074]MDR5707839.1 TlpA disulfide reductase family protein [Agromyces sp. LY-1358]